MRRERPEGRGAHLRPQARPQSAPGLGWGEGEGRAQEVGWGGGAVSITETFPRGKIWKAS